MLTKFIQLHDPKQPHVSRVQTNVDAVLRPVAEAVAVTPMGGAKPPPWIRPTYAGDFIDNNTSVAGTAFHKDALGYVWTRLGATTPGGVGGNATILVYPIGYRPSVGIVTFVAFNTATGALIRLGIKPDGELLTSAIGAGNGVAGYFAFLANA